MNRIRTQEQINTQKSKLLQWAINSDVIDQSTRSSLDENKKRELEKAFLELNLPLKDALSKKFTDPSDLANQKIIKEMVNLQSKIDKQLRDELIEIVEENNGRLPNAIDFDPKVANVVVLIINHSVEDLSFMKKYYFLLLDSIKENTDNFGYDKSNPMERILDKFAMTANNRQYFGTQYNISASNPHNVVNLPGFITGEFRKNDPVETCRILLRIEDEEYQKKLLLKKLGIDRDFAKNNLI
jgi:hypothetical protein